MKFHQPPSTILFDDPHTQRHPPPQIPHIHQKMRKECRNDYMEACRAVYWAKKKKAVLKNLRGLQQPPLEDEGIALPRKFEAMRINLIPGCVTHAH